MEAFKTLQWVKKMKVPQWFLQESGPNKQTKSTALFKNHFAFSTEQVHTEPLLTSLIC